MYRRAGRLRETEKQRAGGSSCWSIGHNKYILRSNELHSLPKHFIAFIRCVAPSDCAIREGMMM